MDPKIILQKSEIKSKFFKRKTNKHLVFDAKKQFKKSRAFVNRK